MRKTCCGAFFRNIQVNPVTEYKCRANLEQLVSRATTTNIDNDRLWRGKLQNLGLIRRSGKTGLRVKAIPDVPASSRHALNIGHALKISPCKVCLVCQA